MAAETGEQRTTRLSRTKELVAWCESLQSDPKWASQSVQRRTTLGWNLVVFVSAWDEHGFKFLWQGFGTGKGQRWYDAVRDNATSAGRYLYTLEQRALRAEKKRQQGA